MAERFARWWRELARDGLPPHSLAAFVFALSCVAAAAAVRAVFGLFGENILLYATYYPAILLASLVGGASAGVFATALSLGIALVVYPTPVTNSVPNIFLFLLSCGATIAVAELYRSTSRRLHAEERKRVLLVRELEHRGKNTFAIVQAIISQTLQDQRDVAENIIGRIRSVSATNDIITKSERQTAGLQTIIARELEPYDNTRSNLRGENLELEAELARSVSLIVHELATNAAKYGALSRPEGRLMVEWQRNGDQVALTWDEQGGPALTKPFEPGFGAKLITRLLKSHKGEAVSDFRTEGLLVRITFLLERANCTHSKH